ncbi:PAS domain S-box protein [bacterium]|nr:PAS domain S-box protein [bacterium]
MDITDRKPMEIELQESREKYRSLFNNALIGLFQASLEQDRILECNEQAAELFGFKSRGEFLKKTSLKNLFVDPDTLENNIKMLVSLEKINNQETQFFKQDGSLFWGRYSLRFFSDNSCIEGVITDVTQQKDAEKALGESEKRFQDLVENSLMGISIIRYNDFIYTNPEQKRIFSPNQNLKLFDNLDVHADDRLKFQQVCAAIKMKHPLKSDIEFRFFPDEKSKQKQEPKHIVIRTDLILYRGEPMTLLNMVDITQTKRMEQLALLKSKMTSLGHVSVGIAHEIRSPLTGINLLIEGIRENFKHPDSASDIHELLDQIEKASLKIEAVVKRVLDFSRPSELKVKSDNINNAIQAAIGLSQTVLYKDDIILETDLKTDLPCLYIDNHMIEQLFLNLINNAVTAMKDQTASKIIRICSNRQDNDILVSVSDSGPGIPDDIKEKIFDPFFSTRNQGAGVGLSICQRIITDHGGVISISTSEYHGAQVNIRLPIEKRLIRR